MNSPEKDWSCVPFDKLTPLQLYKILQLRAEVFVVEQNCAYLDPDGHDIHPDTLHLFHQNTKNEIEAYCRILPPEEVYEGAAIGRVVVALNNRGENLGKRLIKEALASCEREWPSYAIEISAQCQWEKFYSSLGFLPLGDRYLEDGIPHQHMMLPNPFNA